MATSWCSRVRKYETERQATSCRRVPTTSHPLKNITVAAAAAAAGKPGSSSTTSKSSAAATSAVDPLGAALEGSDPLSIMAARQDENGSKKGSDSSRSAVAADTGEMLEPWSSRKAGILSKFSTSEKLSIITSFLAAGPGQERVVVKQASVRDKVKNRLEQIDDFEEGSVKEMLNLTQQDYVNRISELSEQLVHAWNGDQRVKALKIAIQCAKLLGDISVVRFYPSKFVLITDILDTFGRLVYSRIWEKSQYTPVGSSRSVPLPELFTPEQVPDSAKETCMNWFFKTASIRELIPRFYIEAAILKCYSFFAPGEIKKALGRLGAMIRGIGDPLVATYARCYLCRVGYAVDPQLTEYMSACLNDFLQAYSQLNSESVQNALATQSVDIPSYLQLYQPALDWIWQCVALGASDATLTSILQKCQAQCNSALLLNSILLAFRADYVASRASHFVTLIRDCEDTGLPKHLLYRSLGLKLVTAMPPEAERLSVLNDVWKVVMKFRKPEEYMGCAEVWIDYIVKNFGKKELNAILSDIIKHMTPDRTYEDFYASLLEILRKILDHAPDFAALFSVEKFMSYLDMFQKEQFKVEACKYVLEAFYKRQVEKTSDPVIINSLLFTCKTLHDSVNAMTLEDERRSISQLISSFVRTVSFGSDFEQQLSFFVEARANFTSLDGVLADLIQCVNRLAAETRAVVKGSHTRKTAAFVRACAAYCFITIPSLRNVFSQLSLYLASGQVALLNGCASQGEAFLKAAVSLLPELPSTIEIDGKARPVEPFLVQYVQNFLSFLLAVPDNPDQDALYLLRGLLNALQGHAWDQSSGPGGAKATIYLSVLDVLASLGQESYLYHLDGVEANDAMYGYNEKFVMEANNMASVVINEILNEMKALSDTNEKLKKQSALAISMLWRLLVFGDMTSDAVALLAVNLWNLSQKHGFADSKQLTLVKSFAERRSTRHSGLKAFLQSVSQ